MRKPLGVLEFLFILQSSFFYLAVLVCSIPVPHKPRSRRGRRLALYSQEDCRGTPRLLVAPLVLSLVHVSPMIQSSTLVAQPTGGLQIPPLPTPHAPPLKLSLVIPTYNEGNSIQSLIHILVSCLDPVLGQNYELIIVDDDSPDRTWEQAQALTAQYSHLRVMRRQRERGLSTAVIRGWQVAAGEILGVMDGDLQHPPDSLFALLAAMEQGVDLAVASRHVDGGGVSDWSLLRRLLSRGAQLLGLLILPGVVGRVSDPMSGYFMVRRTALAQKSLSPVGYKILLEILGRGEIQTIAEVGYVFQERVDGESKVTWKQYVEYLLHLLRLRSGDRPSQVSRPLRLPMRRFLQFGLVGLSGVFVDMTVLYLLSDPSTLGWGLTRSKIVAAEVAIVNNFLWNDRWTFGDLARHQQGWPKRLKRFAKFNLICLAGLVLNVLILNLLFNVFEVNRYVANLVAIALVTLWNFWLNLKLSWRVTDTSTLMRK
jgi:dolichol-phosphate mannosyltransferase